MRFREYIKEAMGESLFDYESADETMKKMKMKINAPYISIQKSALGGKERTSIIITLSLDPKEEWENRILHNSRYLMWHISRDGTMELFRRGFVIKTKFRKQKAKTIDMVIKKINDYIFKVRKETEIEFLPKKK